MRSVTTIADEQQPDAFLQTGRAEDVELCERFGFRVTQEATFDGEPVWAMLRLYSATVHRTETDGTRQHPLTSITMCKTARSRHFQLNPQ